MEKTLKELKLQCKELGIKGVSGKNKAQLLHMIQDPPCDTYTEEVLKERYYQHQPYVKKTMETSKKYGVPIRLPSIPEDISKNMIKFILHKVHDKTSRWDCKGDLQSRQEGKQECKCFTSDGLLSFTPSSDWDVIYFLDARQWLSNVFVLYKIQLKRSSEDWKSR